MLYNQILWSYDIRIEITGLRPGEKLYEELITEGEGIVPTRHDKLMVLRGNGGGNGISYDELEKKIEELLILANRNDSVGIKAKIREIVPEYLPQVEVMPQIQAVGKGKVERLSDKQHMKADKGKLVTDRTSDSSRWIEELLSLVDRNDNGRIKAMLQEIVAEYRLIQQLSEDERKWFEELLLLADKNDHDEMKTMLQDADRVIACADKDYWPTQAENDGGGRADSRHRASQV